MKPLTTKRILGAIRRSRGLRVFRQQLGWGGEREGHLRDNGPPLGPHPTPGPGGGRGKRRELPVHRQWVSGLAGQLATQW